MYVFIYVFMYVFMFICVCKYRQCGHTNVGPPMQHFMYKGNNTFGSEYSDVPEIPETPGLDRTMQQMNENYDGKFPIYIHMCV